MQHGQKKHRVLLVDDHPVFREGLRTVIESDVQFTVVAEASNLNEALVKVNGCTIDLIVADLRLGSDHGYELIRQIQKDFPNLPVLVLSMLTDSHDVVRAIEAGAKGYLTKGASREETLLALREIAQGRSYLHPEVSRGLFDQVRQPRRRNSTEVELSTREQEILESLCRGSSPQAIADQLFLSLATIKTHMRNLYRKLSVSNRAQLILKAQELGLVDTPTAP